MRPDESVMSSFSDHVYKNCGNLPLLDLIPKSGGRVLDCGCGAGDNARILCSRGWRVDGITINEEETAFASVYCENVFIFDLNHGLPMDVLDHSRYDVVLMSHVLEHLTHPLRLLQDTKMVLTPAGVAAVALPNVAYYSHRINFFLGNFEYEEEGIMDRGHVHFYTVATGAELICQGGLSVLIQKADGNIPLWKLRQLLPKRLEQFINEFACRLLPNLFGRQGLYIAS